ncbi:hypothetical protein HHI36_016442, partial [Cryptolaemus montrouzieri]
MEEGARERSRGGSIGSIDNQTRNLIGMQGPRRGSVGGMENVRKRKFANTLMEKVPTYRKKKSQEAFVVMEVLQMMAKLMEELSSLSAILPALSINKEHIESWRKEQEKEVEVRGGSIDNQTRNLIRMQVPRRGSVGRMENVRKRKFANTLMEEVPIYRKKKSQEAFVVMEMLQMMAKLMEELSSLSAILPALSINKEHIESWRKEQGKEVEVRSGSIDNQTRNVIRMQVPRRGSVGGMENVRKRKFANTLMEEVPTYRKKESQEAFVVMEVLQMMAKLMEELS